MEGTTRALPASSTSPDSVAVLLVSSDDKTHASLRHVFSHTRWRLFRVESCEEAMDFLQHNVAGIVICEPNLQDGSWKDLFAKASNCLTSPLLIVCSEDADPELWAEVLDLGAYDVLSKPFDSAEVTRIVSLAWLHWKEQSKVGACEKTAEELPKSNHA